MGDPRAPRGQGKGAHPIKPPPAPTAAGRAEKEDAPKNDLWSQPSLNPNSIFSLLTNESNTTALARKNRNFKGACSRALVLTPSGLLEPPALLMPDVRNCPQQGLMAGFEVNVHGIALKRPSALVGDVALTPTIIP